MNNIFTLIEIYFSGNEGQKGQIEDMLRFFITRVNVVLEQKN